MKIGDVEITLREAIFSVTIASVLFLVGFLVSTKIEHYVNQANLQYRQAIQIPNNNHEEFSLAMRTDIGNAFADGKFEAVDVVKHKKLDGKWLKIYADHQQYTMHTRTVHYTTTDSKGRVHHHTRVEHYWTWDTKRAETFHSKKVKYIGSEFDYGKFNYDYVGRHCEIVGDGFRKRIAFTCIPTKFNAAVYTKLSDGTVSNGTVLRQNMNVDGLYNVLTTSYAVSIFWIIWCIVIVGSVVMFVWIENDWIEDKKKPDQRNNVEWRTIRRTSRSPWQV